MEMGNELTSVLESLNNIEKSIQKAFNKGLVAQYGIYGYANISETIDILRGEIEGNLQSNHTKMEVNNYGTFDH